MNRDDRLKIIAEALRQTELQLEDLQAVAGAAEARAFQFSSTAVLVATLEAGLAQHMPHPASAYIGSVVLISAACWAIYSVLPRSFHIRGHKWSEWKPHLVDGDSLETVLASQASENDARIKYNFDKLNESAVHFRVSFGIALLSFIVTLTGQAAALRHGAI